MSNEITVNYPVSLTIAVDGTGSMNPVMDKVKANAISFKDGLKAIMEEKGKKLGSLNLRVVTFRDLYIPGDESIAMEESRWFVDGEEEDFKNHVNRIECHSGADEPESSLESLAVAFRNQPKKQSIKSREVVLLLTDASPHPLNKGTRIIMDNELPRSIGELEEIYMENMDKTGKRLIIMAPEHPIYKEIAESFENTIYVPSTAGTGLSDVSIRTIMETIANSL